RVLFRSTIDHVSGGRLTLGIGAGGTRRASDAGVLGGPEWTPAERASRFAEWVGLLDRLLREPVTTFEGTYYSAREVVQEPGCVQRRDAASARAAPPVSRSTARWNRRTRAITLGGRPACSRNRFVRCLRLQPTSAARSATVIVTSPFSSRHARATSGSGAGPVSRRRSRKPSRRANRSFHDGAAASRSTSVRPSRPSRSGSSAAALVRRAGGTPNSV